MNFSTKSSRTEHEFGGVKIRDYLKFNNIVLSNISDPVVDSDAATKKYVDDHIVSTEIYAGTGLTKTGTTFSVNDNLSNVTGVGNINSGTWSANVINVSYGGTGKTSFSSNKLIMGDGSNPLVSISEVAFSDNKLLSTAPISITNTISSVGIGSGGSLTVLGGGSISGKLWLGSLDVINDVKILGDMTVGNIKILGSSSFSAISANDTVYTNMTSTNIQNTNITSTNTLTTNVKTTNITTSSMISTTITNTNMTSTNVQNTNMTSTNAIFTNITTGTLLATSIRSTNMTTSNMVLTNLSGSSFIISNLNATTNVTANNLVSSTITTSFINITNGSITSFTGENLVINSNTVLNTVTVQNLRSSNITSSSILSTNITTTNVTATNTILTNITNANMVNSNILSTNISSSSLRVNDILSTNMSSSNLTLTNTTTTNLVNTNLTSSNLISINISTSSLRVSGLTTMSTINSISLSTGLLSVTGNSNLTNTIVTNLTSNSILCTNFVNTNISSNTLRTTHITTSNLYVSSILNNGTIGISNISTGNIHSSSLVIFNNQTVTTSTISNLRVTDISIFNTVSSSNLSTGTLFVGGILTSPLISNTTQTSANLLAINLRSTNITSSSLSVSLATILNTVTSSSLLTNTLVVNSVSNMQDVIATNITIPNIFTTSITSSNIISDVVTINRTLDIGSNFFSDPKTTSGNVFNVLPILFTDNSTISGGIVPFWSTNFFANSTLTATNPITTQKISNVYIQGSPDIGTNQTIENKSALAIGYVTNETGGSMSGQIMFERNDGKWYGSIFTESATNKFVVANASLAGGGGIGLYTYKGTKITFSDIQSADIFTPSDFIEFSNDISTFYSSSDSISNTSGSLVLKGGLGVAKNITCDSITPTSIVASIKTLQDIDSNMVPSLGDSLVWNGSEWSSSISGGGGGSSGPTPVEVYPMNLVMPVMTSNGPVAGNGGDYYVSASSEFSGLYQAYKCLSSIINPSDWATSGENSNFWIKVQLPSSQNVRYVLLEGRINNEDPLTVTIQGSNDDSSYTDIITNETFTALNYSGYFSARIPENMKDYTFYKFLFPTASGVNPGLNMLRLFKYDNSTFTEGILDNSSIEANGKFNGCIINGRWPMAFNLSVSTIVNIRSQITCFTNSVYVLRKFVMYIDGAPFQNNGSTFVKQMIHQNIHSSLQTLEWTGLLSSGTHTISFFVDGGTGVVFDTNDNVRVNIVRYS